MSKNNIRKIKCTTECAKDKKIINPLSLMPTKNIKKTICNTNQVDYIDFLGSMTIDCNENIPKKDVIINMLFPSINFNHKYILKMYNISNIDSLDNWIQNNLEVKPKDTTYRVLNCWINENINDLKLFNNALFDIIKVILLKFTKIKEQTINKELLNYIDYWINKYDENNFNLNLITDFKNYLSKKYND